MNRIINNELDILYNLDEIPNKLHNITLSDHQKERLSLGLSTGLIEGMVFEDGNVENVKVSLSRDPKTDRLEINYDYEQEELKIPNKILGVVLDEKQKQSLRDGDLLSGFTVNNQQIFIGLDPELNKVVVKTERDLKIPDQLLDYKLDLVDKYYLANGKMSDTRVFQTTKGDYFTARIGQTKDRKGIELIDIKSLSKEKVIELKKTLNVNKTITNKKFMLNAPSLAENKEHAKSTARLIEPVIWKQKSQHRIKIEREREKVKLQSNKGRVDVTIENKKITKAINKSSITKEIKKDGKTYLVTEKPKNSHIEYENITGSSTGFSIQTKDNSAFLKSTFKGVKTTAQQRKDFANGKEVFIKGANINGETKDVVVFKDKQGKFQVQFQKGTKSKALLEKGI